MNEIPRNVFWRAIDKVRGPYPTFGRAPWWRRKAAHLIGRAETLWVRLDNWATPDRAYWRNWHAWNHRHGPCPNVLHVWTWPLGEGAFAASLSRYAHHMVVFSNREEAKRTMAALAERWAKYCGLEDPNKPRQVWYHEADDEPSEGEKEDGPSGWSAATWTAA